jgi:fermentation-respiration switch protein FrsA (DUF1100 family)
MAVLYLFPWLTVAAGLLPADVPPTTQPAHTTGALQETIVGTWNGTLVIPGGELPLVFHIQTAEEGGFTATLDSPAQGAMGIPVSEVTFADGHLRLVSDAVQGEFEGDLSDDGTQLTGTWRQGGGEIELTMVKEGSVPPIEPTEAQRPVVGSWLGTLEVGGGVTLRMVFHIEPTAEGGLTATLDSPDQGAMGIPAREVSFADGHLRIHSATVAGTFEGDLSSDGTVLEGRWMQGGGELPLTLERTEGEVEPPARPQEPVPPLPYDEEEVRYSNPDGGHELAGTLTLPREGAPHPTVVLVSGSGPQDRNETVMGHRPFLVLSDHLTRQGIAVLRFDDRGTAESGGSFAGSTSEDFASDALAGVAYLKGRDDIDGAKIGVIGHSEGGLIAPMVAARSTDVAFIVMMAGPGVNGEEIVLEQGALIARASGAGEDAVERNRALQRRLFAIVKEVANPEEAAPQLAEALRASMAEMSEEERAVAGLESGNEESVIQTQINQVNSPWFRFFLTHDPVPVLRQVSVPVLAVNGEVDLQVPPYQNLPVIERALKEGGNQDVTALELPGLNHLFQTSTTGSPNEYRTIEETIAPTALETISEWILGRVGR